MIVLITIIHFVLEDIRFLLGAVIFVAILIVFALIKGRVQEKRDRKRGWRVGHIGRDEMYYDELRDGAWHRIDIGGELLMGRAHHVIYFSSIRFPDWASERQDEILQRIKSQFHSPDYEYEH